jgi:hypothetical protein
MPDVLRHYDSSAVLKGPGTVLQQGKYIAHKFESGWEVGVIKAFDKKGPHAGKFSVALGSAAAHQP